MEMDTTNIKYTTQRLMIDHNGNFIKRDTYAELESYIADTDNKVPSDAVIAEHEGLNDEGAKFYIETKLKNPDGQYGKFLALKQDKTMEAVNGGTKGNPGSDHTDSSQLEEANWSVHKWITLNVDTSYAEVNRISEHVLWELRTVITLDEWLPGNQEESKVWILDTRPEGNGWAYWGATLKHSADETPESVTDYILKSVTLTKQPERSSEYYIHVSMDALTLDQMDDWVGDVPQEIIDMFNPNSETDPGTDPGEDDNFPGVIHDNGEVGNLITDFGETDWVIVHSSGNTILAMYNHSMFNQNQMVGIEHDKAYPMSLALWIEMPEEYNK